MASARMIIRVTQIARMRLAGIKDRAIAAALQMTPEALYRITKTTDYKEYEEALLQGHLSKMDQKLAKKRDLMDGVAREAVPAALRTIIEVANQRRDLRSALVAAKDILRLDPGKTFAVDGDRVNSETGVSLPASLFESISKDADGVSVSVSEKLKEIQRGISRQDS